MRSRKLWRQGALFPRAFRGGAKAQLFEVRFTPRLYSQSDGSVSDFSQQRSEPGAVEDLALVKASLTELGTNLQLRIKGGILVRYAPT